MKNQNTEDSLDIRPILKSFLEKWPYFLFSLMFCIAGAYVYDRISPRVYDISGIIRLMTEVTKAEHILESSSVGMNERKVNIDDELLAFKSTKNIKDALNLLDFNVSYFTKGHLTSRERFRKNFPVKVQISDSSAFQATSVPFFVHILSKDEFEIEVKGNQVLLYNYIEDKFEDEPIESIKFRKKYRFGQPIREPHLNATITLTGNPDMFDGDALFFVLDTPENLITQHYNKLELTSGGRNSNILILNVKGVVIEKEFEFINALMDVVVQSDLDRKNQENINTINFIDYQLANISDSLYKAERALETYQFTAASIGESGLLYSRRDQYEAQLADFNLKMSYLKNIANNLDSYDRTSNITSPSSVGIEDPLFDNLLLRLSELSQQRIQLGRTATSANPVIQRVDLEILSLRNDLREILNEIIASTDLAISDISNRLRETNATINRLPGSEVRRLGVERKFQFSDNTYDLLLQRKAAAGIAIATTVSDWSIVERARLVKNYPISPNTKFIFLMALILGSGLPATVILVLNALNTKIKDKEDIEKITTIPILGVIARAKKYPMVSNEFNHRSLFVESLYSIIANLKYLPADNGNSIFGFTSSISGEGKSFCVVNLGFVLAKSNSRVLIIDADLRKSTLAEYFQIDRPMGLSDFLAGAKNMDDIINKTHCPNLDVVLSGPVPLSPYDLLTNPKIDNLINDLKNHYQYILIDAPPLGLVSDYLLIQKYVNASIFIARCDLTTKGMIENIDQLYQNGRVNNINILLNDVKLSGLYSGKYKNEYLKEET